MVFARVKACSVRTKSLKAPRAGQPKHDYYPGPRNWEYYYEYGRGANGFLEQRATVESTQFSSLVGNHNHHLNHKLNNSRYSFLQSEESAPSIPLIALSPEGEPPIMLKGKGLDPDDRKYLGAAIADFGKR